MKPLWYRILASALLMALFGWLLGLIYGEPLFTALVSGGCSGCWACARSSCPRARWSAPSLGALLQASTAASNRRWSRPRSRSPYRVIAAIVYRGRPLVRVMAEEVPASELRYVVPFEARSRYVGADYVEQLAKVARRHLPAQPARRRDPRVARQPRRADLRPEPRAPADPRVLRAHQPLQALDHPRVAALDEARLRALQARGRGAARPGRDPLEHRRGPARDGQHDRHDRPRRRRGDRHPRLDPDLRGLRQADLRRHLHELQARRPRLRECRLPDPERELHRHAPSRATRASTTSC